MKIVSLAIPFLLTLARSTRVDSCINFGKFKTRHYFSPQLLYFVLSSFKLNLCRNSMIQPSSMNLLISQILNSGLLILFMPIRLHFLHNIGSLVVQLKLFFAPLSPYHYLLVYSFLYLSALYASTYFRYLLLTRFIFLSSRSSSPSPSSLPSRSVCGQDVRERKKFRTILLIYLFVLGWSRTLSHTPSPEGIVETCVTLTLMIMYR